MPSNEKMPDSQNMTSSDKKRPPLPVNNSKIPAKYHMPDNNEKRGKWTSYNTEEQLMSGPNFKKYFKEYHYYTFYIILGLLQEKYLFMRESSKRNKNELKQEKEQVKELRRIFHDIKIN